MGEHHRGATLPAVGAAVLAVTVFVLVLWLVPPWIQGPLSIDPAIRASDVTSLNGIRTALAAVLVGIGAIGSFYLNSLNQRTAQDTYQLAARGQLTERYSKCVEQLGSESPEVRIGGLYGLEQFARESQSPADQGLTVEILSSFIRRRTSADRYDDDDELQPLTDELQAALTILGRLPFMPGVPRADLRASLLYKAELANADLRGAKLADTRFHASNLTGADLRGSDFTGSRFYGSNLTSAKISDENNRADYAPAEFWHTDLTGALLAHANLFDSGFDGATLSGADFTGSGLAGSSFIEANISAINQFDIGQLVHEGPARARRDQWGPTIFRGSNLRDVTGLYWEALRKCELDSGTKLNGELAIGQRSEQTTTNPAPGPTT